MYGFRDSPKPQELTRQFLHAQQLKIQLPPSGDRPNGKIQEFISELPEDLKNIKNNLVKE